MGERLIINVDEWTHSLHEYLKIYEYDETEKYSLLGLSINKDTNYALTHFEVPEHGLHITLVPDEYIQFHRRKENNWGTRISWGAKGLGATHEIFYDGDHPWIIVPIIQYEPLGIFFHMFTYEEGENNSTYYFAKHCI